MASKYKVLFNDIIWSRGNLYYEAGRVKSLKQHNDKWIAEIRGTQPYIVTFSVDPLVIRCNCPYASDGHKCKHMAAALIAYDSKIGNTGKVTTKSMIVKKNPFPACAWYDYIKSSINKNGKIKDISSFNNGIERYFLFIQENDTQSLSQKADELILLIDYVVTFVDMYYYSDESIYNLCLCEIAKIRVASKEAKISSLDKKMTAVLQKATSKKLILCLIDRYFNSEDDYMMIEKVLTSRKTPDSMFDEVFKILNSHPKDQAKFEAFCIKFTDSQESRTWLINYYKETNQYKKGVLLLEKYCFNGAKIGKEMYGEQFDLVYFYSKNGQTSSSKALLENLMSNSRVKKIDIFRTMKEIMSDDDWIKQGKPVVRNWTKGKSKENCYEIYKAIDAPDLMFEKLVTEGFSPEILREHFKFLSDYDEGIVYSMLKLTLENEIKRYSVSVDWTLSSFCSDFPNQKNAQEALKYILIQLQEKFKDVEGIRGALEKAEEKLYEKSNG